MFAPSRPKPNPDCGSSPLCALSCHQSRPCTAYTALHLSPTLKMGMREWEEQHSVECGKPSPGQGMQGYAEGSGASPPPALLQLQTPSPEAKCSLPGVGSRSSTQEPQGSPCSSVLRSPPAWPSAAGRAADSSAPWQCPHTAAWSMQASSWGGFSTTKSCSDLCAVLSPKDPASVQPQCQGRMHAGEGKGSAYHSGPIAPGPPLLCSSLERGRKVYTV